MTEITRTKLFHSFAERISEYHDQVFSHGFVQLLALRISALPQLFINILVHQGGGESAPVQSLSSRVEYNKN